LRRIQNGDLSASMFRFYPINAKMAEPIKPVVVGYFNFMKVSNFYQFYQKKIQLNREKQADAGDWKTIIYAPKQDAKQS